MSWLLELLVDAIREMCSQFIVDMMELITNMFTELLSCNLSLFEELFSVVGSLYKNVIVPTGIAILLMILVWQLFKSMFGGKAGVNAEEPIELICRSAISLFLLAGSKPLVDYILRIAGTPYQWVIGTKVKVASFSGYVSTLEGVTDTLGISSLSISVLMLIMQFVVAWNYFKMLMVIAERYVLLGVFSYTAPLAFATGGSKATNNILASWSKMFGGQVVLVILNAWCMKMFLSGYGNMMASSYGFTKFFAATLCLVGFCKITFKLDSYMASLGVNLGRPAPGMGAAGAMLAASRIISQAARTASGSGGTGDVGGTRTDMGSSDGMTTNFTGPIPMTPNGGNAMDINDMTSDGDFDKESPPGPGNQQNEVSPANKTVFEELGMTTGSSDTAEMDFGSGDHVNGNIDSMSATSETMSGINAMSVKDDAEAFAGAVSESNSEGETLLDVSGGEQDLAIPAASNVSANGFSESGSEHGILGEMGDYPVEEEMSDFDSEMDLESGSIEMTGQESMSYGKTGTAYNSSVSGEVSNAGEGLGSEIMSALQGNGVSSVNQDKAEKYAGHELVVVDEYETKLKRNLGYYLAVLMMENEDNSTVFSFLGYANSLGIDMSTNLSSPYDSFFYEAAQTYNVPAALLIAMGKVESDFNPNVVSGAGASGIMQLMPSTAASLGVSNVFDPRENIMGGAKYVSQLIEQFKGYSNGLELAIAGYNAGPGAVMKYGYQIPPYAETQAYVKKVLGYVEIQQHQTSTSSSSAKDAQKSDADTEKLQTSYELLKESVEKHLDSFFDWSVTDERKGEATETIYCMEVNGKRGEIDRTTYEQILAQGGNAWQENRTVVSKKVEYTLALLLNAQITGGSGYQYKFVTNKTTFDIVIKLLEYLQKGVDAVKNALSTIFHWTDFVTGGSSGDSFVAGNIDASGDIITYDTVGKGVKKVVYFNQTEEPWKGMSYGSSTIGASGCGPTSMAIIISTLTGQTVTPQMTCAYSIANGEYVPGMGTSHSFPTNAAYHWGLTCERVGKDRMNYVVQSLKEGKMVVEICEAYTITGSGSGHFIVLTGVTRDGYITIADCASRERTGKVYSVETIKSYGRDLSEGAFWIVGKK